MVRIAKKKVAAPKVVEAPVEGPKFRDKGGLAGYVVPKKHERVDFLAELNTLLADMRNKPHTPAEWKAATLKKDVLAKKIAVSYKNDRQAFA